MPVLSLKVLKAGALPPVMSYAAFGEIISWHLSNYRLSIYVEHNISFLAVIARIWHCCDTNLHMRQVNCWTVLNVMPYAYVTAKLVGKCQFCFAGVENWP